MKQKKLEVSRVRLKLLQITFLISCSANEKPPATIEWE